MYFCFFERISYEESLGTAAQKYHNRNLLQRKIPKPHTVVKNRILRTRTDRLPKSAYARVNGFFFFFFWLLFYDYYCYNFVEGVRLARCVLAVPSARGCESRPLHFLKIVTAASTDHHHRRVVFFFFFFERRRRTKKPAIAVERVGGRTRPTHVRACTTTHRWE